MTSGVEVLPACIKAYEDMKIRKSCKFIIFQITKDKKSIEIACQEGKDGDDPAATWESFKSKIPDGDCRYAVYDCEINTKSGTTANKLMFIAWSDDNAPIRAKMLYASSKAQLKISLTGLVEEFQATDRGDLDYKELCLKAGGVAA